MPKNINSILKEVLEKVKPSEKEIREVEKTLASYLNKVNQNIKKRKINAQVFVGGSVAKGTMIKKDGYDVDVFIRFDKKYKDELLSDLTEKILVGIRAERVHGSRDYFKAKVSENLTIEFVPVKKITNPRDAENVTDLSYSHVNYIKKKVKSEKLLDEIRIAKAFCYANGAYGAESYVKGFSGYGLELLIYHYKGFIKFIKAIAKINPEKKEVIDIEKHHKNKNHILMDLNAAKLESPIVLVDPTYKQRNVLAALSQETLKNFQKVCREFLKNPKIDFFEERKVNVEKLKDDADNRGYEFILLEFTTDRQQGDIAGSKLLKFYRHLGTEIERFFDIKAKGFEYDKGKTARVFFTAERKKEIIVQGPNINDGKNVSRFKSTHKSVFIKNSRLYSKLLVDFTLNKFLQEWGTKNREKIREMSIASLEILS